MTTSDTFGIYAVLGALFFIVLSEPLISRRFLAPIAIGLIAGLMHLARTDGYIYGLDLDYWACLASTDIRYIARKTRRLKAYLEGLLLVIGGYLVIMGPWFFRNFQVFSSLLAPGGSSSFWILDYDETFIYPAQQLTIERWLSSGLGCHSRSTPLGYRYQPSAQHR